MVPSLETLRASIDRTDNAIANLLTKRARLAQRVALWKLLEGTPLRDPGREQTVRDHYAASLTPTGWSEESVDTLLATMMHASRDLQSRLRVSIQGGQGSWSDESLAAALPGVQPLHCDTFHDAARASRAGAAVAAWLPVHNSTIGVIRETEGLAADMDAWIEVTHPIRHALVAQQGSTLGDLRRIEGHPRALEQCRETLARLCPSAELVATVDGAHSASHASPSVAVLGSPRLAERPGLAVVGAEVNDAPDNATTFRLLLPREVL